MEELRRAIADHLRSKKYSIIIDGKMYSADELAREVESGSEIGMKLVNMAIRGALERYAKQSAGSQARGR